VRHVPVQERQARLATRQRIAPDFRAGDLATAARAVVAFHATDPASVFLEARARLTASSPEAIERALYDDRSVLRMLAMRRTLFVAALEDVPILHAAAALAIGATERRRTVKMLTEGNVEPDSAAALAELEAIGLAAVRERGEASTAELTGVDPRLGQAITLAQGKAYEGTTSVSSKVFFHLALDGRIGRGRPRGTWIGSQYRWSPIERWLPDGIPAMAVDDARATLVRRWLYAFGPGTLDDLRWWTGWPLGAIRPALAALGAVEVALDDDQVGYLLQDDLDPISYDGSWVALLPALDATTMGWASRDWYLGPHRPVLFDRNGNAGPTIWVDGRVVGGWAQRSTGEVATRLLEDVGKEAGLRVEEEAVRLETWIGAARVRARFPTPLEVELRA
jgi:DNA glycosylase AlkZ-like